MSFLNPRISRVAAGVAVLGAFTVVPVAAQAADTTLTGTLVAGTLSATTPTITALGSVPLTGLTQTRTTDVSAWSINDASGANAGYSVTVSATAPTVAGVAAGAGTNGSLTLTPTAATADAANPATIGPLPKPAVALSTTAATIENAVAGSGNGKWDFATGVGSLSVVIPGDARSGAYSTTLTYTISTPVA
jgi:hypothetical protein